MKRSHSSRMVLLKPAGQSRLEEAFERRTRRRASFRDCAEGYLRCLEAEGRLAEYLIDGLDPFEALGEAKEIVRGDSHESD